MTDAAIETIESGFDSFVIDGAQAQDNVGVVGYTPVVANTYYSGNGTSFTTVNGGQPIIAGSHDQTIVVQMFHADDPGADTAVSARSYLGPGWQKAVAKGFPHTCT